jgi:hypothetical protein
VLRKRFPFRSLVTSSHGPLEGYFSWSCMVLNRLEIPIHLFVAVVEFPEPGH